MAIYSMWMHFTDFCSLSCCHSVEQKFSLQMKTLDPKHLINTHSNKKRLDQLVCLSNGVVPTVSVSAGQGALAPLPCNPLLCIIRDESGFGSPDETSGDSYSTRKWHNLTRSCIQGLKTPERALSPATANYTSVLNKVTDYVLQCSQLLLYMTQKSDTISTQSDEFEATRSQCEATSPTTITYDCVHQESTSMSSVTLFGPGSFSVEPEASVVNQIQPEPVTMLTSTCNSTSGSRKKYLFSYKVWCFNQFVLFP